MYYRWSILILIFEDAFQLRVITFISIPDNSFGKVYLDSHFLENLIDYVDVLSKIILNPNINTYVISIATHSQYIDESGKAASLSFICRHFWDVI